MILVLLGTQQNSFHRLLEEIQKNIKKGNIKEEIVVQKGYTKFESKDMKIYNQMSSEELQELIKKADLIITHGGVGSIISAITNNKKVIAVPRLQKYKEHVNDHQLEIIESFNEKGYIIGIKSVEELEKALKKVQQFEPERYVPNKGSIIKIIEDFIESN